MDAAELNARSIAQLVIQIEQEFTCWACDGSGRLSGLVGPLKCGHCDGSGKVTKVVRVERVLPLVHELARRAQRNNPP